MLIDIAKTSLIFIKRVFLKFHRDRCLIRASGMAFSSLLALVPLSALIFSLLSAFGVFDPLKEHIQQIIFQQLLPTRQEDIIQYVNMFVENTKTLGVVGLLLFTITSVFLISNIQSNFNDIWMVEKKGNFFRQFSVYISVIVISTLLMGSGFVLTGWIESTASSISFLSINLIVQYLITFSPKIIFSLTLFIVILAVPSVKVRFPGALAAAAAGGFLMWAVKSLFISWSNTAIRYSVIYGSIAIIPIFLIWLYLLWVVILLSVEISCVWQTGWDDRNEKFKGSLFDTFKSIFELYLFIAEKYADNSGGASLRDIEQRDPGRKSSECLISSLEKSNLIHRVENGKVIFIPSAPPHTALSSDVIKIITGMNSLPENKLSDVYKTFFLNRESSINNGNYKYINDILISLKKD